MMDRSAVAELVSSPLLARSAVIVLSQIAS